MDESAMKNRVILILVIVAFVSLLLWINSISSISRQKTLATSKAALVYELEEKNVKLEKEKSALSEELRNSRVKLAEEIANHEVTKTILSQEQVAEQALKVELERVTRLKEDMDKDLKDASLLQKAK